MTDQKKHEENLEQPKQRVRTIEKRTILSMIPAPPGMLAHFKSDDGTDNGKPLPVRALAVVRVDVYRKRPEAKKTLVKNLQRTDVCGLVNWEEWGLEPADSVSNFSGYSFPDERESEKQTS